MSRDRFLDRFAVSGRFYSAEYDGLKVEMRSRLSIIRRQVSASGPDLIVVMMNPGSSRPANRGAADSDEMIEAVPDVTQYQVMRVMDRVGLAHARVLNLSDIRDSKSDRFLNLMGRLGPDHPHSLFSTVRRAELEVELGPDSVPVLVAWGLNSNLLPLAQRAEAALAGRNLIGLRQDSRPLFRHPLPPDGNLQKEWVERIVQLIRGGTSLAA